jgi:hypothetical protein
MDDMLLAIIAFILGFAAGLLTKHELWQWVKKHGKTTKKDQ